MLIDISNVNNYQYDGVSSIVNGSGQYSAGSTEYALDGTTTGSEINING